MMDEYIKMVLALDEEFFEGWEWKAGDRAITLTSHREIMIISTPLKLKLVKMRNPQNCGWIEAMFPESDDITHEMFKISDLRPIPSQEQLQNLLIKFHMIHNRCTRKRAILHIMGHWADYLMRKHNFEYDKIDRNQDYEYFGDPEDFDILMLRFTVGIILMLGWNGESWEKMV